MSLRRQSVSSVHGQSDNLPRTLTGSLAEGGDCLRARERNVGSQGTGLESGRGEIIGAQT